MTRARSISRLVSDQVTGNVNISGILTATTLFGEGSGITGVTAVGSGVTILDNGVNKGAASKIDFADHFTVSNISSGITTITIGITTEYIDSKQINNAGVVTTGSAIVGSAVTINSTGINVSGVVTATTFFGALTGTATTAILATNAQGLTGTPDITVNKIVAGLTSSIIPFYWENFSDLPSFSTYHGAFAHVHQTGKAYYAHTRWVELVNKQADGTVGTGTEYFNVGVATAIRIKYWERRCCNNWIHNYF
jgi:hypothetical protein